jgi:hypothetical protein
MEHKLIYTEKPNFVEITCTEGHYITNWDKNDIMEFADAKLMICPLGFDMTDYYCITEEEHNTYIEQQMQKAKEAEEQNKRNL